MSYIILNMSQKKFDLENEVNILGEKLELKIEEQIKFKFMLEKQKEMGKSS